MRPGAFGSAPGHRPDVARLKRENGRRGPGSFEAKAGGGRREVGGRDGAWASGSEVRTESAFRLTSVARDEPRTTGHALLVFAWTLRPTTGSGHS
jgi:hypothetical protein